MGFLNPIKEIVKFAHSKDIIVAYDGAQHISHKQIDVLDLDIDFLSYSAHKMCSPTGIGILYEKEKLLEKMEPFFSRCGMNEIFNIKKEVIYLKPPGNLKHLFVFIIQKKKLMFL